MLAGLALELLDEFDAWTLELAIAITRAAIEVEKIKRVFISVTPRKVGDYSGSTVEVLGIVK